MSKGRTEIIPVIEEIMGYRAPTDPVAQFRGCFAHLHIDWRSHAEEGRLRPSKLDELLKGVPWEKKRAFFYGATIATLKGCSTELFDAAFGGGDYSGE